MEEEDEEDEEEAHQHKANNAFERSIQNRPDYTFTLECTLFPEATFLLAPSWVEIITALLSCVVLTCVIVLLADVGFGFLFSRIKLD